MQEINEIFQALFLGVVQGLTEFLPISSSAHLILIPDFFGWQGVVDTLGFDIALHLGTSVAVVYFFWRDWARLVSAFVRNVGSGTKQIFADGDSRLFVYLIAGSIPAGLIGLMLEKYISTSFRNPILIAIVLIIFAFVLFFAERIGRGKRSLRDLTIFDALVIGLSQAVALIPGVSRSGITISAGLLANFDRESATRFSFLLSTPIILAASLYSLKDMLELSRSGNWDIFLVGFVASAISGFLAIKVLLSFIRSNNFNFFVIYRILLGLGIILLLM